MPGESVTSVSAQQIFGVPSGIRFRDITQDPMILERWDAVDRFSSLHPELCHGVVSPEIKAAFNQVRDGTQAIYAKEGRAQMAFLLHAASSVADLPYITGCPNGILVDKRPFFSPKREDRLLTELENYRRTRFENGWWSEDNSTEVCINALLEIKLMGGSQETTTVAEMEGFPFFHWATFKISDGSESPLTCQALFYEHYVDPADLALWLTSVFLPKTDVLLLKAGTYTGSAPHSPDMPYHILRSCIPYLSAGSAMVADLPLVLPAPSDRSYRDVKTVANFFGYGPEFEVMARKYLHRHQSQVLDATFGYGKKAHFALRNEVPLAET